MHFKNKMRKLNLQQIQCMNLFETITKVRAEDCFDYDSGLIFVVSPARMSKAIGQNGVNVKKISSILKRKIKIIQHTQNKEDFINSVLYPAKFKEIKFNDENILIKATPQNKTMIIGRHGSRLKQFQEILERYFKVKNVKVI